MTGLPIPIAIALWLAGFRLKFELNIDWPPSPAVLPMRVR